MASETFSHLVIGVVVLKPHYKIILVLLTFQCWNTECTGKSPDPLYLRPGDAIHLVL